VNEFNQKTFPKLLKYAWLVLKIVKGIKTDHFWLFVLWLSLERIITIETDFINSKPGSLL